MTAAVGVGFLAGGTVAALAGARATYVAAGLGGLAVIAWTLTRLRAHARPEPRTRRARTGLSRSGVFRLRRRRASRRTSGCRRGRRRRKGRPSG